MAKLQYERDTYISTLDNLGNTCFLNSIIQALGRNLEFLSFFLSSESSIMDDLKNNLIDKKREKTKEGQLVINKKEFDEEIDNTLTIHLKKLFTYMFDETQVIEPKSLVKFVKTKILDYEGKPKFGGREQQDAQEFLSEILQIIDNETSYSVEMIKKDKTEIYTFIEKELSTLETNLEIHSKTKEYDTIKNILSEINKIYNEHTELFLEIKSLSAWKDRTKISYSIINDIMTSLNLMTSTCNTCNIKSVKFEKSDILTLNFPQTEEKRESYNITELIDNFYSSELITGENKYFCSYCNSKQEKTRKTELYQQPNTLVVLVKRWEYTDNGSLRKNNTKLNYAHLLDMKKYMCDNKREEKCSYELYSVVRHSGGTNGGHYYNYSFDVITKKWFRYDDDDVYLVDDDEPLKCNGYILFYKKI